jgi:flagellar motor switch protein FliN
MPESMAQLGDTPMLPPAMEDYSSGPALGPQCSRTLPPYTRSLLRIQLPVVVTLAEKRQPLGRIIELSPGSILQFDKSCEEMLELFVGDRPIACGEAVKVGDKFGLRITSITPPDERFFPLGSAGTPQP